MLELFKMCRACTEYHFDSIERQLEQCIRLSCGNNGDEGVAVNAGFCRVCVFLSFKAMFSLRDTPISQ